MLNRYKTSDGRRMIYESYDALLKLWDTELTELDIDTSWGKTHVITAGSKANPPLVLFHGVGDNSALMWIYNAKALAQHFFIAALDAVGGSGKSEPNERYFKDFDQTKWIDEVLDGLSIGKADLAGVSYGCYLTQCYAIKRPERVGKILCMAGSIACGGGHSRMFRMMKVFLPEAMFPTDKNVLRLIRKLSGDNAAAFTDNADLMRHWACLLRYFNNQSMMYHKMRSFTPQQFAAIRDRMFILIGDRDPLSHHSDALKLMDENKVNYQIVSGAGHGINHEKAERINRTMVEYFLREPKAMV